jgi:hypothetical protein
VQCATDEKTIRPGARPVAPGLKACGKTLKRLSS